MDLQPRWGGKSLAEVMAGLGGRNEPELDDWGHPLVGWALGEHQE